MPRTRAVDPAYRAPCPAAYSHGVTVLPAPILAGRPCAAPDRAPSSRTGLPPEPVGCQHTNTRFFFLLQ
jgi:hypothetical protein